MEGSISGAAQQQHQQQQQTRRINRDRLLQLIIIVSLGRRGHIHGRQGRARLGRRQSCNIIVDIAGSHQQPHTHHRSSPWPPTTSLSLSRLIFSIVLPLSLSHSFVTVLPAIAVPLQHTPILLSRLLLGRMDNKDDGDSDDNQTNQPATTRRLQGTPPGHGDPSIPPPSRGAGRCLFFARCATLSKHLLHTNR